MTTSTRTADGADLDEHIEQLVAAAPPLSAEQRDRLAVLLRPIRVLHADADPAS